MKNWRVLGHKSDAFQSVNLRIQELPDVEVFAPVLTILKPRKDRPSTYKTTRQLFVGYIFVRFDPEVVHTTSITRLNGAHKFVSFSAEPYVLPDAVIQDIKNMLLIKSDRLNSSFECFNASSDFMRTLSIISDLRYESERQARFYEMLKHEYLRSTRLSNSNSHIYSSVDKI